MKRTGNIWMILGLFLIAFILLTDRFIVTLPDSAVIAAACAAVAAFGYGMWNERKKENA